MWNCILCLCVGWGGGVEIYFYACYLNENCNVRHGAINCSESSKDCWLNLIFIPEGKFYTFRHTNAECV